MKRRRKKWNRKGKVREDVECSKRCEMRIEGITIGKITKGVELRQRGR